MERIEELNQSVPIGHIAEPEEIADVVAFLSSDEARYICGSLSGDQWWKSGLLIKLLLLQEPQKGLDLACAERLQKGRCNRLCYSKRPIKLL
jgi:hypothetical protein